jgi:hypothetical protein
MTEVVLLLGVENETRNIPDGTSKKAATRL